jgi:chlorobactene glucosyltransferase
MAIARVDNRFKFLNGTILKLVNLIRVIFARCLKKNHQAATFFSLILIWRVGSHFINAMVASMKHRKLAVLSVLPHYDTTKSFGVKIAVPAVQWLMLSLIPIKLIGKHFNPTLPLTDGMPVMYDAEIFRRHTLTCVTIPENLRDAIHSKEFKQLHLRSFMMLGRKEEISCRYFTSYRFALRRLAGGLFYFFSGRKWLMVSYSVLTTLGPFISLVAMPYPFTFAYLFSVLFGRMLVAALCEQSAWSAVLLFPLQQLVLVRMLLTSLHGSSAGQKG